MVDPFVLLAPIFLLVVVALLRFVGCSFQAGVYNPVPTISEIDPTSATVCAQVKLIVAGHNFFVGSVVQWNGANLPTTYVSENGLVADVTADHIAGMATVTVFNPPGYGGQSTNAKSFTITLGAPNDVAFVVKPPQVATSGDALNDIYKGLNFGVDQWNWEGPPGAPGDIFFSSAAVPSRSFTIVKGGILQSMLVFTPNQGTVTLTDGVNMAKSQLITTGGDQTVTTDWTKCATTVTVEFGPAPVVGADLGIKQITYFGSQ